MSDKKKTTISAEEDMKSEACGADGKDASETPAGGHPEEAERTGEDPAQEECRNGGANNKDGEDNKGSENQNTAENEDLKAKYMRLAADFQNYKRRTEKEKSDIYAYANEKIVTELLDVIDNFERAMLHQGSCADDSMAEGMNMILKQLVGVLEKNNVEEMKAQGEEFDPNFHNAVMTENSVEYKSGRVTQVLQKGYLLNGKVIRPAMVKVAE